MSLLRTPRISSRAALWVLTAALSLGCGGDTPSPLQDVGPVDHIEIRHPFVRQVTWTPTIVSRDSALISSLLAIAVRPGDWDASWHTFPSGEHMVALFRGPALVGSLHFSPGFLLVKSATVTRIRALDSTTYDRLLQLTSWWPPRAEDFPTEDTLVGTPAPIDYALDLGLRRFHAQIEAATQMPPDFAGHYRFVVWGCGTGCTSHVILDLRTGRAYGDTLVDFSCGTTTYSRASGLVITGPDTAAGAGPRCTVRPLRYFLWDRTRLFELGPDPSQVASVGH